MKADIFPLTYRKGQNYWSIFTRQGVKLATINISLAEPEFIAQILTEGANLYVESNKFNIIEGEKINVG